MAHTNMKVTTDSFSQEKMQSETQQTKQMVTSSGIYNEQHSSSSQSNIMYTSTSKGIHTSASSMLQSSQVSMTIFGL